MLLNYIFFTGNSLNGNLNLKSLDLSANLIASLKVCVLEVVEVLLYAFVRGLRHRYKTWFLIKPIPCIAVVSFFVCYYKT